MSYQKVRELDGRVVGRLRAELPQLRQLVRVQRGRPRLHHVPKPRLQPVSLPHSARRRAPPRVRGRRQRRRGRRNGPCNRGGSSSGGSFHRLRHDTCAGLGLWVAAHQVHPHVLLPLAARAVLIRAVVGAVVCSRVVGVGEAAAAAERVRVAGVGHRLARRGGDAAAAPRSLRRLGALRAGRRRARVRACARKTKTTAARRNRCARHRTTRRAAPCRGAQRAREASATGAHRAALLGRGRRLVRQLELGQVQRRQRSAVALDLLQPLQLILRQRRRAGHARGAPRGRPRHRRRSLHGRVCSAVVSVAHRATAPHRTPRGARAPASDVARAPRGARHGPSF